MPQKDTLYLFDRDNLREVFAGRKEKEQLKAAGFSTLTALGDALIAQNAQDAQYVVGLPGVGKTTYAKKVFGAKELTKRNIAKLLSLDLKDMVFVSSDVEDDIAQKAQQITLLHTSPSRVKQQREKRDEEIEEGVSETAFGRSARTTAHVSTDSSILISKLKTDYEEKSRIVMYTSGDVDNWEKTQEIPVQRLGEKRKYVEEGVVAASGKRSPAQIVHMEHQIKKVVALAKELGLEGYLLIGQNSGIEYDLGLTQRERRDIIDLEIQGELHYILSGTPDFLLTHQGKVIKIIPEQSYAIIGKERLPEGFKEGTYQDLIEAYPEFLKHKDSYAVKAFAGYNFITMGNILMEGSDTSVSATFVRECLVKGMLDEIKPYLTPRIFETLTRPENLVALQRRYALVEERTTLLKAKKDALIAQYKMIDPVSKQPLLNRKKEAKILTKSLADKYSDQADKDLIFDYLDKVDKKMKDSEKSIKKSYKDKIYAQENRLIF